MVTNKSISRMFSVFLIIMVLLTGVLPVQAESLASPLYASGDFVWAKSMGGLGEDWSEGIATDTTGNVYTTGNFTDTADFDPGVGIFNLSSAGNWDIFISKLDNSGNFFWAKRIGGIGYDQGHSISVDLNGNIYITGYFRDTIDSDPGVGTVNLVSTGNSDIFIIKLDTNGDFIWAKALGGALDDEGFGIITDQNGAVYSTGFYNATVDFDPNAGISNLTSTGDKDVYVSKLTSNGDFVWAKDMGGTGRDSAYDITLDSMGNVYTTGSYWSVADFDPGVGLANLTGVYGDDIFVSKLNSDGNFIWAKSMGGTGLDQSNSIAVDLNGNVYTTGGYDFATSADFDPGPGIFNLTNTGFGGPFVSKLDSNGNFVWAKSIGGVGILDSKGNYYIVGNFSDTFDFDPGDGVFNITSAGDVDVFVSKLDINGNLTWAKNMGGTNGDYGFGIALDVYGNIYTTGYFHDTADFDPSASTHNLISLGGPDIFVSKLENDLVSPTVTSISRVSSNPNSTSSVNFTVNLSESVTGVDTADFTLTSTGVLGASITNVTGSGSSYTVTVSTGTNNGTIRLDILDTANIVDFSSNTLSGLPYINAETFSIVRDQTFTDTSTNYWAWQYIERLAISGITGGCSTVPLNYCPDNTVTRAQMAVFLLKSIHGSSYAPPAVNGNTGFNDVATNYWAAAFIKQLAAEGITSGCDTNVYCPDANVSRAQMAVFLLKAKYGSAYTPPAVGGSTGFSDVATNYWAAAFIKQLSAEGITSGCGTNVYCPENSVTRAEMAVFLVRTFNLP